jgi:DNA-binding NarL/FixJ family response regulator
MIDILIVDDNPIVRAALRGFLDSTDETRVIGEASDGFEALQIAQRLRPSVTLLDYRMPVADGLSVVTPLSAYTAVLVLTSDERDDLVTAMVRGGARGYLVYGRFEPDDMLRAVRAVASGEGWLSPRAAKVVASALQESGIAGRPTPERLPDDLTAREHDVLNLLCLGLSNAAIGKRLALSEKTVKNHLSHAFTKLNVSSRSEAIVFWMRSRRA